MTLSGGQRFQVLAAAWAERAGMNLKSILERTEVVFTLERLDYLARGVRIGRGQAAMGSLLGVKPVIRADGRDGKYSTVATGRTVAQNLTTMVDQLKCLYDSIPLWTTVVHGRLSDRAESLVKLMSDQLNIQKMEILRISPVLGVQHTGPGIVRAAVVPIELLEDLI
jgi:DegV family protein with EDD domain